MADAVSNFTGSIPDHYDRGLGPCLFEPFGADLARRAAKLNPNDVLEIAAGTGIVTQRLRQELEARCRITATDLNLPMLEIAKAKLRQCGNLAFEAADAMALPFADASFDCLVCQFGVMFFPDKDLAYREALRVLKPGGVYLFNVWDRLALNPFAEIATETIGSFFRSDPPVFYKTPFGYHQIDPIKASLEAAGFRGLAFEIVSFVSEIDDAARFASGLVFGNPVIEEIRSRGTARPEDVASAVTAALRQRFGDRPGRMPLKAIVVSAQKAP